ncbi:hypothetical protein KAU33_15655 [Candidatus Dependentiae bacterium]|nr:hypothetical protein [Candidatus Dependentiae bacterium]
MSKGKGNFELADIRTGKGPEHQKAALKGKKDKSPYASYKGIDKVIAEMLTENTGKNVLDSGGESDRLWQQNQGRDFKKEDATQIELWEKTDEVIITFNLFDFLTIYLELDDNCKKLQRRFNKFARSPEQEDEPWLVTMEEFGNKINEEPSMLEYVGVTNTYNYDNILGGVIQYVSFFYDGNLYAVLQIHNGADIRGGYTEPKIFKIPEADYFIMAQNNLSAFTECFAWDSDDGGYNWYDGANYCPETYDDIPALEFDVRGKKVFFKGTDDEVNFSVMESY